MTYVIIIFIIIQNVLQENRIILTFRFCYCCIYSEHMLKEVSVERKREANASLSKIRVQSEHYVFSTDKEAM